MPTSEQKLLPCPFCGGEAEIERRGTARQSMVVACSDCGCRVESSDLFLMTDMSQWAWNRRSLSAAEGVKPRVKPLVWRETEIARGDGTHEHDGGYEATTGFDTVYMIQMDFGTDSYVWTVQHDMDVGILGCLDDPDAAKALAQADYEARILAALEGE